MPSISKISCILEKYGSDKVCGHSYADFYDNIFDNPKTFLEIGVQYGKSIKAWCEAFPDITIDGIDIKDQFEGEKPKNFHYIVKDIKEVKLDKKYDIIIDDGSHLLPDLVYVVRNLPQYLTDKGKLIIEDIELPEEYTETFTRILPEGFKLEAFDLRGSCDDFIIVITHKNE